MYRTILTLKPKQKRRQSQYGEITFGLTYRKGVSQGHYFYLFYFYYFLYLFLDSLLIKLPDQCFLFLLHQTVDNPTCLDNDPERIQLVYISRGGIKSTTPTTRSGATKCTFPSNHIAIHSDIYSLIYRFQRSPRKSIKNTSNKVLKTH